MPKTKKAAKPKPATAAARARPKPPKGAGKPRPGNSERSAGPGRSNQGFGDFAGPLIGDLLAGALLAGAEALTGQPGKGKRESGQGAEHGGDEPTRAPLEGEVEPARAGAAGVGMVDLAGYAMAIAVAEIAGKFAASYERQMGNGPVVRQTAKGARMAADAAWNAFDKNDG